MQHKALRKHFIESLYKTLDDVISPTPYLQITEGKNLDIALLNGRGKLPKPNTTEITILDIDTASLFFDDFGILWEGVTGTGKSYTADALGYTICGQDGYLNLTLSSGPLGTSAMQPFTKSVLDKGIPKVAIDPEKCSQYGILFIDEINAGDFKDTSRVVEGVAQINGDIEYLRMPIPNTNRYKKIAILSAMNPSDALHSHAQELTIAGENRFLKFQFPNGVTSAGSSQLEKKLREGNLNEQFWQEFKKRTKLQGTWRELYPMVTDAQQIQADLDFQTKEFIDVSLGYIGHDPRETYEQNISLMQDGNIQPNFSIRDDNNLEKVIAAQNTLKHGFVRRDLQKISNLSQLMGFIRSIKNFSYQPFVSLNDTAASIGLTLESKAITGTDCGNLMSLVNESLSTYQNILKTSRIPTGYALRQAIWQSAVYTGKQKGFEHYHKTLQQAIQQLNTQSQNESPAQATLKSSLIADLFVLDHFSKTHEKEITSALKEKGQKPFEAFQEIYEKNKSKASIYEHRLNSILT